MRTSTIYIYEPIHNFSNIGDIIVFRCRDISYDQKESFSWIYCLYHLLCSHSHGLKSSWIGAKPKKFPNICGIKTASEIFCQFLKRPVWRKISMYEINFNSKIQKSKLKRNLWDEIGIRKIKILRELSKIHIIESWRETVSFWRASWVFHW